MSRIEELKQNSQNELARLRAERESLEKELDSLTQGTAELTSSIGLSDRDTRKAGINPVTREFIESEDRGLSGALNIIGKSVTTGLDESDIAGRSLVG